MRGGGSLAALETLPGRVSALMAILSVGGAQHDSGLEAYSPGEDSLAEARRVTAEDPQDERIAIRDPLGNIVWREARDIPKLEANGWTRVYDLQETHAPDHGDAPVSDWVPLEEILDAAARWLELDHGEHRAAALLVDPDAPLEVARHVRRAREEEAKS